MVRFPEPKPPRRYKPPPARPEQPAIALLTSKDALPKASTTKTECLRGEGELSHVSRAFGRTNSLGFPPLSHARAREGDYWRDVNVMTVYYADTLSPGNFNTQNP